MRNIFFRNLTSQDKKRRKISSSEIVDREGIRSVIRRHFVCMVKEVREEEIQEVKPVLFICKERNSKEKKEKFFCKIKGSIHAVNKGKSFMIYYLHTLNVMLAAIEPDLVK